MNIEAIVKSRLNVSDNTKSDYEKWLGRLYYSFNCESKEDTIALLSDKNELLKTFSSQRRGGVSKALYYSIKSHIKALSEYYSVKIEIPSYKEVLDSLVIVSMYKSLDSILNFINTVELDKTRDLLNIKKIVILGWNGLSLDEIALLKYENIINENDKYFISLTKKINITENEYNILIKGGKKNGLVFTSTRGLPKSITSNTLAASLKNFNNLINGTGKAILFRDLRKNALFVEVYKDEIVYGELFESAKLRKAIKSKFNCGEKNAFGFAQEYEKWKEIYYH